MAKFTKENARDFAELILKESVDIETIENPDDFMVNLVSKRIEEVGTNKFNFGLNKGASKIEKEIKNTFAIDDDLKGNDLIEAIAKLSLSADEVEKLKKSTKEETEKKLKEEFNTTLQERISKIQKAKEEETNDYKIKYEQLAQRLEREESEKKILNLLASDLSSDDWNWGESNDVKSYRMNLVKESLSKLKTKETPTGVIVLDENGELKQDNLGNLVRFEDEKNRILEFTLGRRKGSSTPSFNATGSQLSIEALKEKLDTLPKGSEEYKKVSKIYTEKLFNT